MNEALALSQLSQFPPWHLQGEAFILNYWISPQFGGVSKSMLKKSRLNFDKIEKCK